MTDIGGAGNRKRRGKGEGFPFTQGLNFLQSLKKRGDQKGSEALS